MLAPVTIDLPAATSGPQELTIEVDNRFNEVEWPTHDPKYDWYQAGGLVRPVEVHRFVNVISSVRVVTIDFRTIELAVISTTPLVDTVYITFDNTCSTQHNGLPISANMSFAIAVPPDALLWSPEEPNLHL